MTKEEAINLLGGTPAKAAQAIGITQSAVSQWPDQLPSRISDRVFAALVRIGESKSKQKAKKFKAEISSSL